MINVPGELADDSYHCGAKKGCALAADIHDTEVFAGFLRWDNTGKVGTGQGLYAALEHADANGQYPEMKLGGHEKGEDGNTKVGNDADSNQPAGIKTLCESAKQDRAGEGYDLCQQQCAEQAVAVKAESGSVGGGHVDNGIDSVNIEEKGKQEQKDMFFASDMPDGIPETLKAAANGPLFGGIKMLLAVMLHKGKGRQNPPEGDNTERNHHGAVHSQTELPGAQNKDETAYEGNAAADITPGKTLRRNLVQTLFPGNIGQHGVVENIGGGVTDPGGCEYYKKRKPGPDEAKEGTAERTDGNKTGP